MAKPNILWIIMDAVRQDSLSCYGYFRKTTPNLDKLTEEKETILFKNAFSPARWTPPSHASMFTGKLPSHHGVLSPNLYLNNKHKTVAEDLSNIGYNTVLITPSPQLASYRNLNKGFKKTIESYLGKLNFKDPQLLISLIKNAFFGWDEQTDYFNKVIKKEIKKNKSEKIPFFIFVNYATVHWPYDPTFPFKYKFPLPENIDEHKIKTLAGQESLVSKALRYLKLKKKPDVSLKYPFNYLGKFIEITPLEFNALKTYYDCGLSYLDHKLGQLVDYLKKNVYDDTLMIITSDHGEMFGEHNLAAHQYGLYENLIRVPLIIKFPKNISSKRADDDLVSLIDIVPTLLDLIGVNKKINLDGVSLFDSKKREHIIAESDRLGEWANNFEKIHPLFNKRAYDKKLSCVRTKEWKLILGEDGSEEFYNIISDPDEDKNLFNNLDVQKIKEDLKGELNQKLRINEKLIINRDINKIRV